MADLSISSAGTTFFSGTISGIDTQSLIENAVNAKLRPRKRLDDQVTINTNKISAYQKVQTQTASLRTALNKLKSDVLGNSFSAKQASYASSNSSVTAASVLSATVTSAAQAGSYSVVVNDTAKAFSAQGTNQTSTTTALSLSGSFDIGEAGKTAATINFTASSTIQDIATAINATTTTSGVSADILQVSPGNYRLVIRGADTAKAVSVTNITGSNVLNTLGVTNAGGAFLDVTQPPTQASITLNGTTVLSDSNKFSNVLTGVTIDVASASPSTTITVTVGNNTDGVKAAIEEFVASYNTLRQTLTDFRKINEDGTIPETSYLYNEGVGSLLLQSLSNLVTGTYGSSTTYKSLSALGISLDSTSKLVIDSSKLTTALKDNFNDVRSLFETNGASIGLADTGSTVLDSYSNSSSGSITQAITAFQSTNIDLKKRSDAIKTSVDAYQIELINKYAKLETLIKNADTVKKQIKAILDGSTNNN